MANVRGVVNEVKVQQTSVGTMFNLVVDGQIYGAGKFKPNVNPGDIVQFESIQKGRYSNLAPGTLQVVGKSNPAAAQSSPAYSNGQQRSTHSKGVSDFGKNQEVISRQAARNSAIAMLAQLVALDAVPVAKTAKPGDKFDAVVAIVDKLTEKYFNHSQGKESVDEQDSPQPEQAAPEGDLWT